MSRGNGKYFHKKLFGQWKAKTRSNVVISPLAAIKNYVKGLKFTVVMKWVGEGNSESETIIEWN
jgi:hypothetical protein